MVDVWCSSGCIGQNITDIEPQRKGLIQCAQGSHHTGTQKQHEGKVTAKWLIEAKWQTKSRIHAMQEATQATQWDKIVKKQARGRWG